MSNKINMIVVTTPLPYTGGGYRALMAIKEYEKRGINPFIVLPWSPSSPFAAEEMKFLLREGLCIYGCAMLPRIFQTHFPFRRSLANFLISRKPSIVKIAVKMEDFRNFHCVMSMHECIDAITTCLKIGELFSLKTIALLQLPPFYGERQRLKNIEEARRLWLEALEGFEKRLPWGLIREIEHSILKNMKRLLSHFELILAVSRSIPIEMGEEWLRRVISLDPGVALSQEDVYLINSVLKDVKKKEEIIIFGGRPSSDKGIIEALIAFKEIKRNIGRNYKLVITGGISNETLKKIRSFCDKIKIKDNVLFCGFVPRRERLALVAKSKIMLYPSHVDAFPYAVLESLYLNTPVVAYDIPALRIYYDGLEGVSLVKEFDIEALAQKVVETIERQNTPVERPKFIKSWDKIMDEETDLIKGREMDDALPN